jgi:methyl-accepting chemotaxis protein
MVHAYYCKFDSPAKRAFHDFLDVIRGRRITMCFKAVTGFYGAFIAMLILFFLLATFVYGIKYNLMFLFITFLIFVATYPFAYYLFRVKIFEPVHQISVKWLIQQQIVAKPDQHTVDHTDILTIGNREATKVISYLETLEKQAQAIAQGDFDSHVHDNKIDGTLGDAFSKMRENLRLLEKQALTIADGNLMGDIFNTKVPGNVGSAFEKMRTNLTDVVNTLRQNSSTMTKSAQDLSASSEEVTASMEQVSGTMQELATKSKGNMEQAKQNDSGDRIKSLDKKSEDIENIVTTIQNISEQTNLLALNAAIEAARAGEAGRGFAVVADEVRKLAEESSKSSEMISTLINDIRGQIKHSVQGVETTLQDMEKMIQENDTGFTNVNSSVGEVTNAMTTVAQKAEDLSKGSESLLQVADKFKTK